MNARWHHRRHKRSHVPLFSPSVLIVFPFEFQPQTFTIGLYRKSLSDHSLWFWSARFGFIQAVFSQVRIEDDVRSKPGRFWSFFKKFFRVNLLCNTFQFWPFALNLTTCLAVRRMRAHECSHSRAAGKDLLTFYMTSMHKWSISILKHFRSKTRCNIHRGRCYGSASSWPNTMDGNRLCPFSLGKRSAISLALFFLYHVFFFFKKLSFLVDILLVSCIALKSSNSLND